MNQNLVVPCFQTIPMFDICCDMQKCIIFFSAFIPWFIMFPSHPHRCGLSKELRDTGCICALWNIYLHLGVWGHVGKYPISMTIPIAWVFPLVFPWLSPGCSPSTSHLQASQERQQLEEELRRLRRENGTLRTDLASSKEQRWVFGWRSTWGFPERGIDHG